jgi:hypothetical protein
MEETKQLAIHQTSIFSGSGAIANRDFSRASSRAAFWLV